MKIKTYKIFRLINISVIFTILMWMIYEICLSVEMGNVDLIRMSMITIILDIPLFLYFLCIIKASKRANLWIENMWHIEETYKAGIAYAKLIQKDVNSIISKMIVILSCLSILASGILFIINISDIDGIYCILYYIILVIANTLLLGVMNKSIDIIPKNKTEDYSNKPLPPLY